MAVGQSIITADGINALANAAASGTSVKPKYFVFSHQDLVLDPKLSAGDIHGWRTQDISLYQVLDSSTVEFVCDVAPTEATDYTHVCGLYLEDGTLFMVAKPPFPFPPQLRQTFKVQMVYANADRLLDFRYLPYSETEQSLAALDVALSSALRGFESAQAQSTALFEIGEIKKALARQQEEAQIAYLDLRLGYALQAFGNAREIGYLHQQIGA